MNWMWTGSQIKLLAELNRLVMEVLLAPGFNIHDLQGFDARRETARLDSAASSAASLAFNASLSAPLPQDAWRETAIQIPVPDSKRHNLRTDPPVPLFEVNSLHYRSITETIKATWSTDCNPPHLEFLPFHQFWQRKSGSTKKVYDEVYTSEAFIEVHAAVQNAPAEPGCTLERTVCALMFWSDSTHLATFGTSSLWPIYLTFGNQSKYSRANSGERRSCHHLAYIPKVSCGVLCIYS